VTLWLVTDHNVTLGARAVAPNDVGARPSHPLNAKPFTPAGPTLTGRAPRRTLLLATWNVFICARS